MSIFRPLGLCCSLALGAQVRPEMPVQIPEITDRNLGPVQPVNQGAVTVPVAPAPPRGSTGPALDLPRDRGAHPGAARERWSLKIVLRDAAGRPMPCQVSFLSRSLGGERPTGAWSRSRILTAHAALALDGGKRTLGGSRRARLGLSGEAAEDRVGLRCDGWSLTDPGDGRFHLDLALPEGRVRLTLAYKGEPHSLPPVDASDPLRRTLRTRLEAQGRVEVAGRVPMAVSGTAALLQEWGPDVPPEVAGWDQALVFLRDGHTLAYLGLHAAPGSKTPRSLLLELDPQGLPTRVHHPPAPKPKRTWASPHSRARYPVAVQIQDPRQPLAFEPILDDQEWRGNWVGASALWNGFGQVKDLQGAPVGDAFLELAGYAHPVQGRY